MRKLKTVNRLYIVGQDEFNQVWSEGELRDLRMLPGRAIT